MSTTDRLTIESLIGNEDFEIVQTRWFREIHPNISEGCLKYGAIEIIQKGTFRKESCGRQVCGDANSIVIFSPGVPFRVSHPSGMENQGVTIRLSKCRFLELMMAGRDSTGVNGNLQFFSQQRINCTPSLFVEVVKIQSLLNSNLTVDCLEIEERVIHIVSTVVAGHIELVTNSIAGIRCNPRRNERVVAAIEFMNQNYAKQLTLKSIASVVECSTWHLSREFRAMTGIPVYRYLKSLRLRQALMAISDGCHDLSALALQVGFYDHSHLTSAFRDEFQCTPITTRSWF